MSIHELQAALRALDEARANRLSVIHARKIGGYVEACAVVADAEWKAEQAARRVAEGAGEPVADIGDAQKWRGMDGAIAYHLIDRHADNWSDSGLMMEAWRTAHTPPRAHPQVEAVTDHCADLDRCAGVIDANAPGFAAVANEIRVAATELRAALAAHKENTDGR